MEEPGDHEAQPVVDEAKVDDAIALHARALIALEAGRRVEAMTLLVRAATDSLDFQLLNDLAVVAHASGWDEEASAILRTVTFLAPEREDAERNLRAVEASLAAAVQASPPPPSPSPESEVSSARRPVAVGDGYLGWDDQTRLTMGRHSYGFPTVLTYGKTTDGRVEVGSFCSIAAGVVFLVDGQHRHDFLTTSPLIQLELGLPEGHDAGKGPIVIENDVWIGRDAAILSGVRIGTGAVVGAFSVVTKDVRPYAIVGGNPAREIRRRFSDEDCELLLASRWWEWSDERIAAAVGDLWSTDVRGFIERWAS